jgi:hypothetical protein
MVEHRLRHVLRSPTLFLICTLLAGCNFSQPGAGPLIWIDRPLAGDDVSISQPVILQAHASDSDGIARFEFFVSDKLLGTVSADGGRMAEASMQWQPPGPGLYRLGVRAFDRPGNPGALASVEINIGGTIAALATSTPPALVATCAAGELAAPALLSPADGARVEGPPVLAWAYPDPSCQPASYAVDISPDASFVDNTLGFGTLDASETSREWPLLAGQCYVWRVRATVPGGSSPPSAAWTFCVGEVAPQVEMPTLTLIQTANCRSGPGTAYAVVEILTQGQVVTVEGRNAETTWFWVQRTTGTGSCWISKAVGELAGGWATAEIIAAPPLPITTTAVPTADSVPPVVSDLNAVPALISAVNPCGATPALTIVSARVSEAGGIQRVVARIPGEGEFTLSAVGGGLYQATLGAFSEAGSLSIFVQAWDSAGNAGQAGPITVQVVSCPG